jgi:alpha-glucosidase
VSAVHSPTPWWQTTVVYQIYPWSFADSNGDGIGDLAGITSRLDHLVDLGVGAVWLSPFYRSPMNDFGYDVADYCDVDPRFGTLADAEALMVRAHELGLRVIVDLVPNHSSIDHPWFVDSASSRDNAHHDWYVWQDWNPARTDGRPNNWLSVFGGPAWSWNEVRQQWYLHSFLPQQPDLNWRNPAVQDEFDEILRFWLSRGVDGFRVDVAHFMMKDPDMRDDPTVEADMSFYKDAGDYSTLHHTNSGGHLDNLDIYRRWRDVANEFGTDRYLVGEIHDFSPMQWMRWFGEGDGLTHPFNFSLLKAKWDAQAVRANVDEYEAALATKPNAWGNWVMGNHDEHRIASRLGAEQAKIAMLMLLTLRGTPTLYYGDELGMNDVEIAPDQERDPWGIRVPGLGLGRDPERSPMLWDTTVNAGFCADGVTPWLPIGTQAATHSVAVQRGVEGSTYCLIQDIVELRRSSPALTTGGYQALDAPDGVFAYERTNDGDRVIVALNFTNEPKVLRMSVDKIVLSTHANRGDVEQGRITLQPNEGVVLR